MYEPAVWNRSRLSMLNSAGETHVAGVQSCVTTVGLEPQGRQAMLTVQSCILWAYGTLTV